MTLIFIHSLEFFEVKKPNKINYSKFFCQRSIELTQTTSWVSELPTQKFIDECALHSALKKFRMALKHHFSFTFLLVSCEVQRKSWVTLGEKSGGGVAG